MRSEIRASLRWVRLDVVARRGQAMLAVFVVAGAVAALVLAATTLQGATNPWQGLFDRARGAHVMLLLAPGTPTRQLSHLPGVIAVAGPYQSAPASLRAGGKKASVELRAMRPALPAADSPLLRAGHWLSGAQTGGVVLETSFAQALQVAPGDSLTLESVDGGSVPVKVAGTADTSDQGFYPQQQPGLVWVLPSLLRAVEKIPGHTQEFAGLRIGDATAAPFVAQRAVDSIDTECWTSCEEQVVSVSTWQDVQQSMSLNNRLLGLLLAVFGIAALVAAALAIANATGGRVLAQLQDIAMLKALGFTPGQVLRMLLAEHGALGAVGIAAGLAAARLLTTPLLQRPPATALSAAAPLPVGLTALIAAGAEIAVVVATLLPIWRARRVPPAAAVHMEPPLGRLSRLARTALLIRLPPALVLGARDVFTRRLRAVLVVGGLAVPMVMITVGLASLSTLNSFTHHPRRIGLAAALTVQPGRLGDPATQRLLAQDPQVAAFYPEFQEPALVPSGTTSIVTRGMGTSARPYPFQVVQGRIYRAPNEAVAGQGMLDLLHVQVGQWARLTVQGVPLDVHIVGRTLEPADGGQVLSYGTDAFGAAGGSTPVESYGLVLRAGADPASVREHLLAASGGQVDVEEVPNPAAGLGVVRWVIVGLIAVLALIGLTNLMTATAVGLRDHLRDIAVLKAIGLTPRQVIATLVTGTSLLALIGVTVGSCLGIVAAERLINLEGRASGIGAGLAVPPSAVTIAATVAVVLAGASATAFLLARNTAHIDVAAVLREPVDLRPGGQEPPEVAGRAGRRPLLPARR